MYSLCVPPPFPSWRGGWGGGSNTCARALEEATDVHAASKIEAELKDQVNITDGLRNEDVHAGSEVHANGEDKIIMDASAEGERPREGLELREIRGTHTQSKP